MKKVIMSVLLGIGWGLVIYLVQNPPTTRVYIYYPEVDFGETYTVNLGDGVSLVFRKHTNQYDRVAWVSECKVTIEQVEQYEQNSLEYMYYQESEDCGTNDTATMVYKNEARKLCDWLTQRETLKNRLPNGYYYSVVPMENYHDYVVRGDDIQMLNGFYVKLSNKQHEVVSSPLLDKLVKDGAGVAHRIEDHLGLCIFLLIAGIIIMGLVLFCWNVCRHKDITDET
ncbi:hypothetical protein PDESU_03636 [Pontiella desulfatans]|uniref:Uncharacterized protein n=1 Tax=Pontiella desulfatans TaxID=2750659 RepID=A0A6C2U6P1_PONDE|nr:hypothetical protein [Pontiella desulfatans]VGO15056.1 hypothetical protein PDESU_03636 [Pontiella desulfatans]